MLGLFRSLALCCLFSLGSSETYCPVVNNKINNAILKFKNFLYTNIL